MDIRGDDALRAAGQVLPHINHKGASARTVQNAVAIAAQSNDAIGAFSDAAHLAARARSWKDFGKRAKLTKMPEETRLALEMISHEDAERRALEGELHVLEEAWRQAEEIAALADDMFLPEDVSRRLSEMKRN
jgi:hypothetical protein